MSTQAANVTTNPQSITALASGNSKEWSNVTHLPKRPEYIASFETNKTQPVLRMARRRDFLSGLVTHDDTMIALIDLLRLFSVPEIAKMN